MKDLCRKSMLYNIKPLYLHRVFHGIRFKVNNWRLAVRDGWLFSFIGVCYSPDIACKTCLKKKHCVSSNLLSSVPPQKNGFYTYHLHIFHHLPPNIDW